MLTIQIEIRSVYGENKAYPANHAAECIANIANTKTLTGRTLSQILQMGATVQEVRRGQVVGEWTADRFNPSFPMVA